jgi:hypothetical protein
MEHELQGYNEDQRRQFAILLDRQHRDLSLIDADIISSGVNIAELADSMQDIHFLTAQSAFHLSPHDHQLLSMNSASRRSMISLPYTSNVSSSTHCATGTTTNNS